MTAAEAPQFSMRQANRAKRGKPTKRAIVGRISLRLRASVAEAVRDVVYFSPGLTINQFMTDAIAAHLKRARKLRGAPFPSRGGAPLRLGRRAKPAAPVLPAPKGNREKIPA